MARATAELVFLVAVVAFAALVSLGLMVAVGEMIWQNRRRRHTQPRAIDVDLRVIARRNGRDPRQNARNRR